eukprot:PRCOL_00000838-RA
MAAAAGACDVGDVSLAAETKTPGAYSSPCMELPQRTFVRGGRELVVEQRLGSTGSAARRTGIAVWESCAVLTAYLDAAEQREHGRVSGARVLALGSGVGLDVLTAHALGAAAALATDANDEALALASANAERYSATLDADELVQRPLGVRRLRWGVFEDVDAVLDGGAYDLLLGSDLTYNPNAWPQLVSTVVTLLEAAEEEREDALDADLPIRPYPPAWLYAARSRNGAQGLFRELAAASGLAFERVAGREGEVEVFRVTLVR